MSAPVDDHDPPIQGQRLGEDFDGTVSSVGRSQDEDRLERGRDGHGVALVSRVNVVDVGVCRTIRLGCTADWYRPSR